jgi:predicted pyridoxine 5'-phosphate oxidase superfamily flavin-nucleotide-binding protein
MRRAFADIAFTPAVRAMQERMGSRAVYARLDNEAPGAGVLGDAEIDFITARDSFYLATVSETGWPYVQHKGGPPGFVKVLGPRMIGWADFRGNVQYVSDGNLARNDRVSMILVDYANRRRLKLMGHARVVEAAADPALLSRLQDSGYRARVERAIVVDVAAWDWNCPQHITPRYTEEEVAAITALARE